MLQDLRKPANAGSALSSALATSQAALEHVLQVLGGRRFIHLSRTQAQPYLARMREPLQADVDAGRPLRFCYDLGPGYHASVEPDFTGLRLLPALGELLVLRQIHAFGCGVARVYAPGVHFSLVIDDLCAWVTNDVAPIHTARFIHRLKALVRDVGMQDRVSVLSESAVEDANVRTCERLSACLRPAGHSP